MADASPIDSVTVEAVAAGGRSFDRFTSVEIKQSITQPWEAGFELGDDGSWADLQELTALGAEFRVTVNDRLALTGRVELRDSPADASGSSVLRFVVRSRLTDAIYASADPAVRVKGVSVRDFVVRCYHNTLGIGPEHFVFRGDVTRDLLTGKQTKGGASPRDMEALKEDQAKIKPPESVFAAVDRHLRRHGLMHWDSPDGRIVVAAPDDQQDPLYYFRLFRGAEQAQQNNLSTATRTEDVGEAASLLAVFGVGGGREFAKAKVSAMAIDDVLLEAGFRRPVLLVDESVKTTEQADRRVRQEQARRKRRLSTYTLTGDGLAHDDGSGRVVFAPDTVCDLITETQGGAIGRYYVESVTLRRDAGRGDTWQLQVVQPGTWEL